MSILATSIGLGSNEIPGKFKSFYSFSMIVCVILVEQLALIHTIDHGRCITGKAAIHCSVASTRFGNEQWVPFVTLPIETEIDEQRKNEGHEE